MFGIYFPHPQEPVPETAPHVASPQLFSAVHPFPQLEQLTMFPASVGVVVLVELSEKALTAAIPPTINNPKIIEAIIHVFILTSYMI